MRLLRSGHRLLVVAGLIAGIIFIFEKYNSLPVLRTVDFQKEIEELRDVRSRLLHTNLGDRLVSSWRTTGAKEASAGAENGQKASSDAHPIAGLMHDAQARFDAYEHGVSKTFRQAVARYRQMYGRHPPPGFERWYKFARQKRVHNIDDFQQINDDLRPFWGVQPATLRNLAANMWRGNEGNLAGISIRDHAVVHQSSDSWRCNTMVSMISGLAKHLPDMDIILNSMDQPRVVVPWNDLQTLLQREVDSRQMLPDAQNSFTSSMKGFLNVKNVSLPTEEVIESGEWFAVPGEQYMKTVQPACPPGSPANRTDLSSEPSIIAASRSADSQYKENLGGLVHNWNASNDLCIVGPSLMHKHGLLFSSSSMMATRRLVPVFGECKVNVNNDILFPANMYWLKDERYVYNGKNDVAWAVKANKVVWRGVTSGGTQNQDNWREQHRQRLVMGLNSTLMQDQDVRILNEQAENRSQYENYRNFRPSTFAERYTDVGFTEPLGCVPDCGFYDHVWTYKPSIALGKHFLNKYLLDVDGHSFSGRWRAFLQSRSLGIKATIFREWHDSRLFAWKHFVPMDNRYDDLYTILTYFIGVGSPNAADRLSSSSSENSKVHVESHDEVARQMALASRDWANKVLRREDIEIYMYRLLLEYARIMDDNRDHIGYSQDGSELAM